MYIFHSLFNLSIIINTSGSDPGMLDYFIWPWFERIGITEAEQTKGVDLLPKDRFPVLTRWMDDMWKTVAVKAVGKNTNTHTNRHTHMQIHI